MEKVINYTDLKGSYILVDVRSPGEYYECNIPGSINIPLFTDYEREIIGTVYVKESVQKAKELGIQFASKKLLDIFKKFNDLKDQYKIIVVYCARGGMRSDSICSILNSLGLNVWRLRGGYKGYRQTVNEELPKLNNEIKYIVLNGNTGVGKTKILRELENKGIDILDLEEAANHRGSFLGGIGLSKVRSQKQFEGLIYEKLRKRKTNIVFIEGESKRIGSILIPEYIFDNMSKGNHILINASLNIRIKNIVDEYIMGENPKIELIDCLHKLRSYMSNSKVDQLIEMLNEEKYNEVAKRLMIDYYDPLYEHSQIGYAYDLTINADNISDASDGIIEWTKNKFQGEND
jgi:tRNA 2-selenouridine synthase